MNVTIDITNDFNQLIDYIMAPKKPIIFLNFPSSIVGTYELELMNFMLNLNDDIIEQFKDYNVIYDKLINNNYAFKSLFLFGKAKITFDNVKGADVEISLDDDFHKGKKAYHTWEYKVEKGDLRFECGGYASFLPYFILINILCQSETQVKIKFSTDDCIIIDSSDDSYALSNETKYEYTCQMGKMLNKNFINQYFVSNHECLIPKDIAVQTEF